MTELSFCCKSPVKDAHPYQIIFDTDTDDLSCSCQHFAKAKFCSHIDATLIAGERAMIEEEDRPIADEIITILQQKKSLLLFLMTGRQAGVQIWNGAVSLKIKEPHGIETVKKYLLFVLPVKIQKTHRNPVLLTYKKPMPKAFMLVSSFANLLISSLRLAL